MPLWKIYHPVGAFSAEQKKGLSEAITALYSRLPKFYVGVVFQEVAAESFYVGGEPADNFVRIWVDHIARTLPTAEARTWWIGACDAALAPYIRDRGFAWEFHIGGYQPAQKWLKDRKGRALSFDDVIHYQKIIKILIETDRIMREIELPLD